jgi:hypothetical protein
MFETGAKITVVLINGLGCTMRREIIIAGQNEHGDYLYKFPHRRAIHRLQQPYLAFEGHQLRDFKLDSETNIFLGNACYNFVTDEPEDLKAFLEEKNLNKEFNDWDNILFEYAGNRQRPPRSFKLFSDNPVTEDLEDSIM